MTPADWQPQATIENLRFRAQVLNRIRSFFADKSILEVSTPVLGQFTVSDPHLDSIIAEGGFLQTSPEYHMKRLLASGSGDIYQITSAFRAGDSGTKHNPEFTLLEWYREGFDHFKLMAELAELLSYCFDVSECLQVSYRQLFMDTLGLDPFAATVNALHKAVASGGEVHDLDNFSRDECLDLLMARDIEPKLGLTTPVFIYHYPVSQAALAKIVDSTKDGGAVACRFELYWRGLELANGYWELTDVKEQASRFEQDNLRRKQLNKPIVDVDELFMGALDSGMPSCSGVALGIERLLMAAQGTKNIEDVLAFRH